MGCLISKVRTTSPPGQVIWLIRMRLLLPNEIRQPDHMLPLLLPLSPLFIFSLCDPSPSSGFVVRLRRELSRTLSRTGMPWRSIPRQPWAYPPRGVRRGWKPVYGCRLPGYTTLRRTSAGQARNQDPSAPLRARLETRNIFGQHFSPRHRLSLLSSGR